LLVRQKGVGQPVMPDSIRTSLSAGNFWNSPRQKLTRCDSNAVDYDVILHPVRQPPRHRA
jgi:hypothetical protein